MSDVKPIGPSRRRILHTMLASAAAGLTGSTALEFAAPGALTAQVPLTPDAAVRVLLIGNQRFAANQFTSVQHDLEVLRNHTADKQEPFAAVLACADSRVPVELIFDQTIGRLFVARVAGNLVSHDIFASL